MHPPTTQAWYGWLVARLVGTFGRLIIYPSAIDKHQAMIMLLLLGHIPLGGGGTMKYTMENITNQIDCELAKRPFLIWVKDEVIKARLRKRIQILNWLKSQTITKIKE